MKWKCDKCVRLGKETEPCFIEVGGEGADHPSWCPWSSDPWHEDEYPDWEVMQDTPTVSRACKLMQLGYDPVSNPSHYTEGRKYEPIDVIEDWELGFCTGNALKYISRAGRKDNAIQDLEKAKWYVEREIKKLKVTN